MRDFWHSITKALDYERGKIIGIFMAVMIVVVMVGCNTTIKSPFSGKKVDSIGLQSEILKTQGELDSTKVKIMSMQEEYNFAVEQYNAKITLSDESFKQAELIKANLLAAVSGVATDLVSGTPVNTASVLATLIGLAGIGGTVGGALDSYRKNKVISTLKEQESKPT